MTDRKRVFVVILVLLLAVWACPFGVSAAASDTDWPMWRYDANRSAASPVELPAQLHLQWKRELPAPRPAFPLDVRLCFDLSYEPVVMGKTMFLPSMVTDSVTAFDTETGAEKWKFFADGPIRFAPVAWRDKVYFVSDDGHLYCVDADNGKLLWKVRGTPPRWKDHKLLGNERMVSRWPALGGPVLAKGKIYFAAGFWTNEGVYVCGVDAASGKLLWRNEKCSFVETGLNDHGGRWYGGLCPQGYLAVIGGRLVVPNGRALPAFFDLESGEMEPYTSGWGGRYGLAKGSWWVCGIRDYFFQSGDMFGLTAKAASIDAPAPEELVTIENFARLANVPLQTVQKWIEEKKLKTVRQERKLLIRTRKPGPITYVAWWTKNPPAGEKHTLDVHPRLQISPMNQKEVGVFREPILTRDAIYYSKPKSHFSRPSAASYTEIIAYDTKSPRWGLSLTEGWGSNPLILWKTLAFDVLWSLPSNLKVHIKAGSRLYAGRTGVIAAVAIPKRGGLPKVSWKANIEGVPTTMLVADHKLFAVTNEGTIYCFGGREGQPKTYPRKKPAVESASDEWTRKASKILKQTGVTDGYCLALGMGGGRLVRELVRQSRLCVVAIDPDAKKVEAARRILDAESLYGKRIHVLQGDVNSLQLPPYFAGLVVSENLDGVPLGQDKGTVEKVYRCLRPYGGVACLPFDQTKHMIFARRAREAKLPGAEVGREGELTLLKRAGPLPGAGDWTHGDGSAGGTYASKDQALKPPLGLLWFGGRMHEVLRQRGFSALAISRGRMFIALPGEIHAVDIYTGRQVWKKDVGVSNIVAVKDGVYVVYGGAAHWLDPATGRELRRIQVPTQAPENKLGNWRKEYRVWGDFFVGFTTGKHLVCVDRHNGKMLWRFKSRKDGLNFVLGGSKVFCVGYWTQQRVRRGEEKTDESEIIALDVQTGKEVWRTSVQVPPDTVKAPDTQDEMIRRSFLPLPPRLTYEEESDTLLLTAVRGTTGAYRGRDGTPLWKRYILCQDIRSRYTTEQPPIVLPDVLITHAGAMYDLRTGSRLAMRLWMGANTGKGGTRGCGRALANRRIATVRDAHASYFDLATGCETFIRGIRSGCRTSLFPADGVLSAPYGNYRCTCNYGIRTSFALAHIPEVAPWTIAASKGAEKRLRLTVGPGQAVQFYVVAKNWQSMQVRGEVKLELPDRWSAQPEKKRVVVSGHGSSRCPFEIEVPSNEKEGVTSIKVISLSPRLSVEPSLIRVFVSKAPEHSMSK